MEIGEYARAVARCIAEAAKRGMVEPWFLTRPGRPPQDLTRLDAAEILVWRLVESDQNTRDWLTVGDLLSPEINYCIQAIRDMRRVEHYVKIGNQRLAGLRGKVTEFGEPAPGHPEQVTEYGPSRHRMPAPGHPERITGEAERPAGPLPTTRPAGRLS